MLKIGIIGCGRIAEVRHAPEYTENPHCRLVAYYDDLPERAKALADAHLDAKIAAVQLGLACKAAGVDDVEAFKKKHAGAR